MEIIPKKKYRKNHFIVGYSGNKREEIDEIMKHIEDKEYKKIIEPFSGTSAFSVFYHYEHKAPNTKYILNDSNKNLIEIYKLLLPENKERLKTTIETLNSYLVDINKEKYDIIKKKDTLESYIFINKVYAMRPGLFPTTRTIIKSFNFIYDTLIYKFMQENHNNITLSCDEATNIIEKYKNDEDALIFMDPPYMLEYNKMYHDSRVNIYEYLYNNQISTYKAKTVLCLNDNWIIRLLFNTHIKESYKKLYQQSKKANTHIVITN